VKRRRRPAGDGSSGARVATNRSAPGTLPTRLSNGACHRPSSVTSIVKPAARTISVITSQV